MGVNPRSDVARRLIGNSIKVDAVIKLKIGDKEIEIRDDPPTSSFYSALFAELFAVSPSAVLKSLGGIRIVDSSYQDACTASGSSVTISRSNNQITVSGTCTYNSNNAPSKVQILTSDLSSYYFEASVPSGTNVQNGLPVSVSWTATITVTQDLATGYLSGASFTDLYLANSIAMVLAGSRGSAILTLQYVEMIGTSGTQTNVSILPKTQLTRDQVNQRAYISPTKVATSGQIQSVVIYAYYNSQYIALLKWTLNPALTVGSNDYVSLDVAFSGTTV